MIGRRRSEMGKDVIHGGGRFLTVGSARRDISHCLTRHTVEQVAVPASADVVYRGQHNGRGAGFARHQSVARWAAADQRRTGVLAARPVSPRAHR
jgi:hypothetical protein